MAGWRITLKGRHQELDQLMRSMFGDPDWSIAKDQGGCYLTPKRVFHEAQVEDVHTAAASWTNNINLSGPLLLPEFQKISFALEHVNDDGTRSHFAVGFAHASGFMAATAAVIGPAGKPVQAGILPNRGDGAG